MAGSDRDVFINCPFDDAYRPLFYAIVFTVVRFGYLARCALEADNFADIRLQKICGIIDECRFGIHDISRTEVSGDPPVPRFNMPLELGLFLGARRFGNKHHKLKSCIVFDKEKHRFDTFISDIAGQDIRSHEGDLKILIRELAAWLRLQPGGIQAGGGKAVAEEYAVFEAALPGICATLKIEVAELEFGDFNNIVSNYVATL